jgi:hypothetical protein
MNARWYRGELISRNSNPAGLKWQCHCDGTFIYADTLAGIKQLVKETLA